MATIGLVRLPAWEAGIGALIILALSPPAIGQLDPGDRKNAVSQTCAQECHVDIWNRKVMHGPAATNCSACHLQGNPDDHNFFLVAKEDKLCQSCHDLPHKDKMHTPVREGRCLECHDPHGSDHANALLTDPVKLCITCHRDDFNSASFVHGPVAIGACVLCHEAHSSPRDHLLRDEARTLCLTCHDDVMDLKEGDHLHGALNEDCTACHDAHASDHRYQLHATAPELCATCHQDVMDAMTTDRAVVHGAILEEGGCSTCHAPHSSSLPGLQKMTQPKLCLTCHNKDMNDHHGQPLQNMQELLSTNANHHGPIREGLCTACHDPHSGDHFRLLVEEYPQDFYAPFDIEQYKLCFRCHIPDLVQSPKGTGLTEFRNGEQNLHWVHVNQEKGRTCRACHEVHASSRPAHIRESVPFGSSGWMLEINFAQSDVGGSCAPACHSAKTYDRTLLPGAPQLTPAIP